MQVVQAVQGEVEEHLLLSGESYDPPLPEGRPRMRQGRHHNRDLSKSSIEKQVVPGLKVMLDRDVKVPFEERIDQIGSLVFHHVVVES